MFFELYSHLAWYITANLADLYLYTFYLSRSALMQLYTALGWEGIAFIVTFATFYQSFLKPANLSIRSSGRFTLRARHDNFEQTAIALGLNFSNSGVRAGILENLYISLAYPDGNKVVLVPIAEDLDDRIHLTKEDIALSFVVFTSFTIPGTTSVSKKIIFAPLGIDRLSLVPGLYGIDVFSRTTQYNWKKSLSISISVDDEDIITIKPKIIKEEGAMQKVELRSRDKLTIEYLNSYKDL